MSVNKLCVGAASRLVIEEAAKLQVPQIVASRAQVNVSGGYIGMDQHELVQLVCDLSGGVTQVVRDHGGPLQGGFQDDGVEDFDACLDADFDALHIDVCMLPRSQQASALAMLCSRYAGEDIDIEVGGEHDDQDWLDGILHVAQNWCTPTVAVADVGGYCWADRQTGNFRAPAEVAAIVEGYHAQGVMVKAHNCDWYGRRRRYVDLLDYWNVAPEFGKVETEARLSTLAPDAAASALRVAYNTHRWMRWFNNDEGTYIERATCALRYEMANPRVAEIMRDCDEFVVRARVKDALQTV